MRGGKNNVGQNCIHTRETSTAIVDSHGGTCTDARGSPCTDTHIRVSTSKDACGITCTDDRGITCTDVSTDSKDVHISTCPYISTKCMGMHRVMSTYNYMVNTVVGGRTNLYENYRRYETKRNIGTDVVGKVWKGIRYTDALQQVS